MPAVALEFELRDSAWRPAPGAHRHDQASGEALCLTLALLQGACAVLDASIAAPGQSHVCRNLEQGLPKPMQNH